MIDGFSYIAVDPEINTSLLTRHVKRVSVLLYDFNMPFNKQILSILKRGSVVLWTKCKSEYFINKMMPTRTLTMLGIPAVFCSAYCTTSTPSHRRHR